MATYERMSPPDASFVYGESEKDPMHIGALVIMEDDGLGIEDIRRHVETRTRSIHRLRRRVEPAPLGFGRPVWVDDDKFDIRYHVRHVGVPRGGDDRELLAVVDSVFTAHLDHSRPLWELWVVDLQDDRKAFIWKLHHCLVDGVSGMEVLNATVDRTAETPVLDIPEYEIQPAPSKTRLLVDALRDAVRWPVRSMWRTAGALSHPFDVAHNVSTMSRGYRRLLRDASHVVSSTSLPKLRTSGRHMATARINLDAVKRVKRAHGVTVNDVVLATISGALRSHLAQHGEVVDSIDMRAAVPVNERSDGDREAGNQVGAMFAELPVAEADPIARLRKVNASTTALKESHEADSVSLFMGIEGLLPRRVASAVVHGFVDHQWVMNMVITNVPGPPYPLYFMGNEILDMYPLAPMIGKTSLSIGAVSYQGRIEVGLTADWDAMPDVASLGEAIEKSFAELEALTPD